MEHDHQYKGVPTTELRIESIHWSEDATQHIRGRSLRKGRDGEVDIEPEWATEAALDRFRLVSLPSGMSEEMQSLAVVGWSVAAGRVLKVWIWSDDPTRNEWNGASACLANSTTTRRYWSRQGVEEEEHDQ